MRIPRSTKVIAFVATIVALWLVCSAVAALATTTEFSVPYDMTEPEFEASSVYPAFLQAQADYDQVDLVGPGIVYALDDQSAADGIELETAAKPKHHKMRWHHGIATWYSIADNTPRGSRATSSGKPLGWNHGFTCASRRFPLGTKLLIVANGRKHSVVVTDRGGNETVDLYKRANDYFRLNGRERVKYRVLRRGW